MQKIRGCTEGLVCEHGRPPDPVNYRVVWTFEPHCPTRTGTLTNAFGGIHSTGAEQTVVELFRSDIAQWGPGVAIRFRGEI